MIKKMFACFFIVLVSLGRGATTGHADTGDAASTNAPPPAEETQGLLQRAIKDTVAGKWLEDHRINVSGHIEAGITGNFDDPRDRQNFGRLFDDRANEPLLNQALFTIERPLAPQPGKWDWGFKFQFLYGSDARFIHTLGWLDSVNNDLVQPDIVELYGNIHIPYLTPNGLDVKAGQFVTLMGAEVISAPGNPFYSHSYIFNFGIPFKHTGFLVTAHVTEQLDVMAGMVTGINTGTDDNNDAVSFHGGFGWHTKDSKLSLSGSLHYGPENDTHTRKPGFGGTDPNDDARVIGSIQVTIKPIEKLTLITDLNYGYDDGFHAEWYGVAQYAIYQINDWLSLGARAEAFRDDDGFAVAKFVDNDDFIDLEHGQHLSPKSISGGDTTYTELTFGLNIAPCKSVVLRPEVRWDWAAGGNKPFNDSSDNQQFTVAMDLIWKF
jgi:hypothetical protein